MNAQTYYQKTAGSIATYLWQELEIQPGVHYRLKSAVSGPRVLTLAIVINPRYASKIMAMSEQLSMAAGLDKGQSVRIGRGHGGSLTLEIPKPADLWYNVPLSALPRRHRGIKATLGLDNEHRPALLDFAEPTAAHCLVAGATGSGKTNAQRLIVHNLAMQNDPEELAFILIDIRKRGVGWRPFEHLPHLAHPIITDDEQARRVLAWAIAEVDRRSPTGQTLPQVFIGIDEAQALLEDKTMVRLVSDLAAVGREFGLHLVAATQNPTADTLGDVSIKRNITSRLVGRVDSGDAARVAAGQAGVGAEYLTGAGDMLLILPGQMRRLTVALLMDNDIKRLPYTNAVRTLDLDEYDDPDHVAEIVSITSGRNPDPLDAEHVYSALVEPDISLNELYRRFSIRKTKAKAAKRFALEVLGLMKLNGYYICQQNTGTEQGKILVLSA